MKILNPRIELQSFFRQVEDAAERVLLLDYDGTLAPFRVKRDEAFPYPHIKVLLQEMLSAGHSRIVIISGRAVQDLVPLLGLASPPEIWGTHGMERLTADGKHEVVELDEKAKRMIHACKDWIKAKGLEERSEFKAGAIAMHWRDLKPEQAQNFRQQILETWRDRIEDSDLVLKEFDGGLELRSAKMDKGGAVKNILAESTDRGTAAYLGDDFTDEDAFAAIKGRGVGVLVREQFRETKADIWIVPPEELHDFLKRWHEASGG